MRVGVLRVLLLVLLSLCLLGPRVAAATTPTNTLIFCTPADMFVGTATSCTASVTGFTGSVAGETISFTMAGGTGGIAPNTCTLSSDGSCTQSIVSTAVGTATIQASYAGDSVNSASYGVTSVTISKAAPTMAVSCSPSTVAVGSSSACTATLNSGYNPSGVVSWSTSGSGQFTPMSECSLSSAECAVNYTSSAAGVVQITASYAGDSDNVGASSSYTLTASKFQSSTSVTCSPQTLAAGSQTTCTATVTGYTPTGTVSWSSTVAGTFSSGSCALPGTSPYSCETTFSPQASGTVEATYSGDANNLKSGGTYAISTAASLSVEFIVDNSGPPVTVALSGCDVSPKSVVANGVPQAVQTTPGCTPITAKLPAPSGNTQYVGPGGVTSFTIATCSTGSCQPFSATIYYQLLNIYQAVPASPSAWTSTGSIDVVGTSGGTQGATVCGIQVLEGSGQASCQGWSDYGRPVSMADLSISSTQRWSAPQAMFTDSTGGNTHQASYYSQVLESFSYSVVGPTTTPPPPLLGYAAYGVSGSFTLVSSQTKLWLDSASMWSVPATLIGSTSSERWATTMTSGPASAGQSVSLVYYHQYLVTLGYSIVGSPSGASAPAATLSLFGVQTSFQFMNQTSRQQTWGDAGGPCNFTNPLVGSTTTGRWFAQGTEGVVSSSESLTPAYYQQVAFAASFSVVGGGRVSPPQLSFTALGSNSLETLAASTATYWLDAGSSWKVSPQLPGSGSSERWMTTQSVSGTAAPLTEVFTYQHQYAATVSYALLGGGSPSAPQFSYSSSGATISSALSLSQATIWIDSGSVWNVPMFLGGSTSTERWVTASATTGTVTGAFSESPSYQHQYFVKVDSNTAAGGTFTNSTQWFDSGAKVNLTASAGKGWRFEYWKGAGAGSYNGTSAATSLSVDAPAEETAMFYPGLLVVSSQGGSVSYGYGSVTGSISGGTSSTLYVSPGENVTLNAVPSSMFQLFSGWSGNLTGGAAHAVLAARGPATVTATFGANYLNTWSLAALAIVVVAVAAAVIIRRRWW